MKENVDFMKFLITGVCFLISPAASLAFDHADRTSLTAALERYAADNEAERFDDIDRVVPPGFYRLMVERTGEPEVVIREKMIALEERLADRTDTLDVSFDFAETNIETTPAGTDYAFVPTTIVTSEGLGPDVTTHGLTIALQDSGRWYFFRLRRRSDYAFFQAAYPAFQDIKLPQ